MDEVADRYPGLTMTVRNGEELRCYDAFLVWMEKIKKEFCVNKDYKGMPMLPECWLDGIAIYEEASEIEKRMIASSAMTGFIEALRHWKVDRDDLFGRDGWKNFPYY